MSAANDELERLRAELERLHSWVGLLELLDEHWPEDIFPTEPDSETRDPGPRIVSLLRWVERLRAEIDRLADFGVQSRERDRAAVKRLRAEMAEETAQLEALRNIANRNAEIAKRERAERDALKAELTRIATEIEAERKEVREAEGATLRDENVITGIINGLGIALRIVQGEP